MLHIPGYSHLLFPSEINTQKRTTVKKKKKKHPEGDYLKVLSLKQTIPQKQDDFGKFLLRLKMPFCGSTLSQSCRQLELII